MFERFTERARQVVVLAQDEARALGHSFVGTEHLLLGLLREQEGIGARVLTELGVSLDEARAEVERACGRGEPLGAGPIPFTPRATKVLELSLREALSFRHDYIGTEHVLLGLVRERDGVAAQILAADGLDAGTVRDAVIQRLGGPAAIAVRPLPLPGRFRLHAPLTLVVAGWLLFALALGVGIAVGWAIWG
ncbi:MAG TPA: Clp protease N-terminal domain-containing protein [Gaiellaceae bacterium]|nr:Clp protease N-terminal domain-containing protein [Gaiellaceae bacterium]